jgi:LysM repeat protein
MHAIASQVTRVSFWAIVLVAAGSLLLTTGCGKNKAANAQTPPPQTLSEPVRPAETAAPLAPVVPGESDYSVQRPGESVALPAPVIAAPAPVSASPAVAGGKYHMLAKGETIYALSRKYGVKPQAILQANHFKDANHLAVGTKVYIPN